MNAPSDELPDVDRRRVTTINVVFAYVALGLTLVQGIFLVPLYLRRIDVSLYGAWLATGNILSWIELADPGIGTIVQQRVAFFYGAKDRERMGEAAGTALVLSAVLSLLPIPLIAVASWICSGFNLPEASHATLTLSFKIGVFAAIAAVFSVVLAAINTGFQLTFASGAVNVVASLAGIGTTLGLLVAGRGLLAIPIGLLARALVLLVGNGLVLGRFLASTLGRGHARFARQEYRELRSLLGLTFILRLGAVFMDRFEALLAARIVSPHAAAMLVLTGRAAEIGRAFASRLAPTLVPGLSHLAGAGGRERIIQLYGRFGIAQGIVVALLIGGVVATNEFFVSVWVGSNLYAGNAVTVLQAVSVGLWILVSAIYQVVVASGAIRMMVLLPLADAALRLPLQIVLGRRFGVVGLPLASAISISLVSMTYALIVSHRLFDTDKEKPTRAWARSGVITVLAAAAGVLLHTALRPAWLSGPSLSRFVVLAAIAATTLLGTLLVLDGDSRGLARDGFGVIRRRLVRLRVAPPHR